MSRLMSFRLVAVIATVAASGALLGACDRRQPTVTNTTPSSTTTTTTPSTTTPMPMPPASPASR